jgi:Phosphohistidine phosphatase SixA
MSRIILVRHGEASWHAEDYDQVTPKGHAQAVVVGEELRARGIVPGVILSGTLRRHRETAAGLLEGAGGAMPSRRTSAGTSSTPMTSSARTTRATTR